MLQTAFAIGNSVAVTIPKRLGIVPGTKFRFVPTKSKKISYEPISEPTKFKQVVMKNTQKSKADELKSYREYIKKHSGAIKLDMSSEDFMKLKKYYHDHFYEEG